MLSFDQNLGQRLWLITVGVRVEVKDRIRFMIQVRILIRLRLGLVCGIPSFSSITIIYKSKSTC